MNRDYLSIYFDLLKFLSGTPFLIYFLLGSNIVGFLRWTKWPAEDHTPRRTGGVSLEPHLKGRQRLEGRGRKVGLDTHVTDAGSPPDTVGLFQEQ